MFSINELKIFVNQSYLMLVLLHTAAVIGGKAAGGLFLILSWTDWSWSFISPPTPTSRPWFNSVSNLRSQHSLKNGVYDAAAWHKDTDQDKTTNKMDITHTAKNLLKTVTEILTITLILTNSRVNCKKNLHRPACCQRVLHRGFEKTQEKLLRTFSVRVLLGSNWSHKAGSKSKINQWVTIVNVQSATDLLYPDVNVTYCIRLPPPPSLLLPELTTWGNENY